MTSELPPHLEYLVAEVEDAQRSEPSPFRAILLAAQTLADDQPEDTGNMWGAPQCAYCQTEIRSEPCAADCPHRRLREALDLDD
jgi:hypothetical protein